jgi:type II secretory pathway component PulM
VDWTFPLLLILVIVLGLALMWRPPRARRRNIEEALASDELRKEQEEAITNSQYLGDRYNVPGRGRKF